MKNMSYAGRRGQCMEMGEVVLSIDHVSFSPSDSEVIDMYITSQIEP